MSEQHKNAILCPWSLNRRWVVCLLKKTLRAIKFLKINAVETQHNNRCNMKHEVLNGVNSKTVINCPLLI